MIWTVGDILPLVGRHLDGAGTDVSCEPGRSEALEAYNRFTRLLLLDGDWVGTEVEMLLPIERGRIALPREVEGIKAAVWGKDVHLDVRSTGFQYLEPGPGIVDGETPGCLHALQYDGIHPTHHDLPCPMHVMGYSDRPEAGNALLTIIGSDAEGLPVQTANGPGYRIPIRHGTGAREIPAYTGGDGFSDGKLATIRAVRKPRTAGRVSVFGFLPPAKMTWLTTLAPDETSGAVTRYKLDGVPRGAACLRCLASLRAIPLYHEDDVSIIQQPDAYERMAKALSYYDDGDIDRYAAFKNSALSVLRKQQRQVHQGQKVALNVRVSRSPARIRNASSRS